MATLVAGVIGFSLLAVLFTAVFLLIHRRRASRLSLEETADRYQREIRRIQRITHARSEHRYTRQVGDGTGGGVWTNAWTATRLSAPARLVAVIPEGHGPAAIGPPPKQDDGPTR